ncbi:MAG TPA: hypothetical protein VH541_05455 [Gaiellaceae bacterium]|jgi:hypothetical protein
MSMMGGYPQPSAPTDREIVGQLVGYESRNNGWMRFAIMEPGRQYAVKVDTKKTDVINAAMALGGQTVVAQIREQQSDTINPHTNQPYTNRYLNQIAMAGMQPQPQTQPQQPQQQTWGQPTPQPTPQPQPQQEANWGLTGAEKDLDIHRQVAWKCACFLAAGGVIETNPVSLVEAAEVAMAYFTYGPLRFGVTAFDVGSPAGNGAAPQQPQQQDGAACPDCGYPYPQHAYGCPRGDQT